MNTIKTLAAVTILVLLTNIGYSQSETASMTDSLTDFSVVIGAPSTPARIPSPPGLKLDPSVYDWLGETPQRKAMNQMAGEFNSLASRYNSWNYLMVDSLNRAREEIALLKEQIVRLEMGVVSKSDPSFELLKELHGLWGLLGVTLIALVVGLWHVLTQQKMKKTIEDEIDVKLAKIFVKSKSDSHEIPAVKIHG